MENNKIWSGMYLRNEFDFWKVHGFTYFARDPKYSWFHEPSKIEFITYIYFLL